MNLRPPSESHHSPWWEEIGVWNSEESDSVEIKDIVWPGEALKPPEGIPSRRFLSITFLEEDPYIMLNPPTSCSGTKGAVCQVVPDSKLQGVNVTEEKWNPNSTMFKVSRAGAGGPLPSAAPASAWTSSRNSPSTSPSTSPSSESR
jgi:hypothetical protein